MAEAWVAMDDKEAPGVFRAEDVRAVWLEGHRCMARLHGLDGRFKLFDAQAGRTNWVPNLPETFYLEFVKAAAQAAASPEASVVILYPRYESGWTWKSAPVDEFASIIESRAAKTA